MNLRVSVVVLVFLLCDGTLANHSQTASKMATSIPQISSLPQTQRYVVLALCAAATLVSFVLEFFIKHPLARAVYVSLIQLPLSAIAVLSVAPLALGSDISLSISVTTGCHIIVMFVAFQLLVVWVSTFMARVRWWMKVVWWVCMTILFLIGFAGSVFLWLWVRWRLRGLTMIQRLSVGNITVRVWDAQPPLAEYPEQDSTAAFVIPHLLAKKNVGVALSGGGVRASALSVGVIRALNDLSLLSQIRYISSVSGGSWFTGPFSFQTSTTMENFLGPYLPPENCTLAAASSFTNGSFLAVLNSQPSVSETYVGVMVDGLSSNLTSSEAWEQGVNTMFLQPFNLGSGSTAIGVEGISSTADTISGATVVRVPQSQPYPIFNAAIRDDADPYRFQSIEFTPQYSGIAATYNFSDIALGGLVETVGFNSDLLWTEPTAHTATVQPEYLFNLPPILGASSSVVGLPARVLWEYFSQIASTQAHFGLPFFKYWSPQFPNAGQHITPFADGAGTDNIGVLSLLRRRVQNILAVYSYNGPLTASDSTSLSPLFGQQQTDLFDVSADLVNSRSQVFDANQYSVLMAELQQLQSAGKPLLYRQTLNVLTNEYAGIAGGWAVQVLWLVVGGPVSVWESLLPQETQSKLARDRDPSNVLSVLENAYMWMQIAPSIDNLKTFPGMPMSTGISNLAAGLESQLGAWIIRQAEADVRALFV